MAFDWVEAVKLIGGIVAIPTALFIVYDRAVRGRPIFAIHADGKIAGENRLFLRVKNVVDEDIVIEDWRIDPPIVGLSTDHSQRAMVAAQIQQIPRSIVSPMDSLALLLVILGAATGRDQEEIEISAKWTRTRKPWPFQRRIKIKTTVARLKEWKEAHRQKDEAC